MPLLSRLLLRDTRFSSATVKIEKNVESGVNLYAPNKIDDQ